MKTTIAVAALVCFVAVLSSAQEKIAEPSTGKNFPSEVRFNVGGTDYTVKITGVAVRKKLVFKVYGMAHYIQEPVKAEKIEYLERMKIDLRELSFKGGLEILRREINCLPY